MVAVTYCKFCESQLDGTRCETGSDLETGGSYYCGNEMCPVCLFCQGRTDVTEKTIRSAKELRNIHEAKPC